MSGYLFFISTWFKRKSYLMLICEYFSPISIFIKLGHDCLRIQFSFFYVNKQGHNFSAATRHYIRVKNFTKSWVGSIFEKSKLCTCPKTHYINYIWNIKVNFNELSFRFIKKFHMRWKEQKFKEDFNMFNT